MRSKSEEIRRDMFECIRIFFGGKSFVAEHLDEDDVKAFAKRMHLPDDYNFENTGNELIRKSDNIFIVKSCDYAAILFSENEARRRAEWIMDEIGTEEEGVSLYMNAKHKSLCDFAVAITRFYKENGKIISKCISIDTFADLLERLQKDKTYA